MTSEEELTSDDEASVPPFLYVSPGTPSPSGNARKRARVALPGRAGSSPIQRLAERPVKPIPARIPSDGRADARKRKRVESDATIQEGADLWPGPEIIPADKGHTQIPIHDRGGTLMYQQQGPPAPFTMQPPYGGHNAFSGAAYQGPFYPPQPYIPQGWPSMPLNNGAQQWGAPNPYNQEELDPYTGMRRGGYGNGSQY